MAEFDLRFSPSYHKDIGSFKLLELPPELLTIIDAATHDSTNNFSLAIKGSKDDDAVLCTAEKTYSIRSVVLSNSVLVAGPESSGAGCDSEDGVAVGVRDQLHEVLELTPAVPRLHKLQTLLGGREYDEGHEDDEDDMSDTDNDRPRNQRKLSYRDALETLQASDAELDRGLKERRILILHGHLRPIAPSYLITVLELLLTHLVSLSLPPEAASVSKLSDALEEGYEVRREVCEQVMAWFGEIKNEMWNMDVNATVKEVGLGILRAYKDDSISEEDFLAKWKNAVGDRFESKVSLELLSGNYLSSIDTMKDPPIKALTYFPSSLLPIDPAARFTDLFLTRPRWKAEDITPFLADIVIDSKERDKLLLKFTRTVTDAGGIWYTARAKYNG